jgi:hypothetical protein
VVGRGSARAAARESETIKDEHDSNHARNPPNRARDRPYRSLNVASRIQSPALPEEFSFFRRGQTFIYDIVHRINHSSANRSAALVPPKQYSSRTRTKSKTSQETKALTRGCEEAFSREFDVRSSFLAATTQTQLEGRSRGIRRSESNWRITVSFFRQVMS